MKILGGNQIQIYKNKYWRKKMVWFRFWNYCIFIFIKIL